MNIIPGWVHIEIANLEKKSQKDPAQTGGVIASSLLGGDGILLDGSYFPSSSALNFLVAAQVLVCHPPVQSILLSNSLKSTILHTQSSQHARSISRV